MQGPLERRRTVAVGLMKPGNGLDRLFDMRRQPASLEVAVRHVNANRPELRPVPDSASRCKEVASLSEPGLGVYTRFQTCQRKKQGGVMPTRISDEAFEFLVARAGLSLSDAEKAELKEVCDGISAMAARVRQPRGRMAEPALTYGFAEEDL